MKKYSVIMLLLSVTTATFAQFKIASNGYISALTTETASSPLSINYGGSSHFFMACDGGYRDGFYCKSSGVNNTGSVYGGQFEVNNFKETSYHIGLRARANGSSQDARPLKSYGLMADANHAYNSFGVFGSIDDCNAGAAIYGTTNGGYGATDAHLYAGYFNGDAKVTGDFTVNGSIQGVLLTESASVDNIQGEETALLRSGASSTLGESLSNLSVSVYKMNRPAQDNTRTNELIASKDKSDIDDEFPELEEYPMNVVEEQYYAKKHYGISAEDLEKMFPDLVYNKDDGTKVINYVEMIPLLVQCINELSSRLSSLEDDNVVVAKAALSADAVSSVPQMPSETTASLSQNVPNPFSERTVIRFTLPEDVQNAYIYIFDMQGKMQKQIPVNASMQSVTVNGYELSAGMYIYSLVVNGKEVDTKRMILSK